LFADTAFDGIFGGPAPHIMRSSLRHGTWKCVLVAMLAAVAIVQTAAAQASEEPRVGTRIRIGLPDTLRAYPFARHGQWVVGTVVRATQDSLVLHVGGANPLSVARHDISGVDVSRGSSRARSAVDYGLTMGLFMGAMRYSLEHSERGVHDHQVAIFAGSGVAVGAIIGALSPFEHWKRLKR